MSKTTEQDAAYLAALVEERKGYEAHGDDDRLAQVDAELTRVRDDAKAPAKRAQTR